jgi:hypothetical protein
MYGEWYNNNYGYNNIKEIVEGLNNTKHLKAAFSLGFV